MKYQLIEKEIYSEADCLHFGEKYEMGEIINHHLPDSSGVPVGNIIFESEEIEKVKERKRALEIQRLKTVGFISFFDDDELADEFYTSDNFTKLKELYAIEFNLELVRINHNQMVVNDEHYYFYFPTEASDEQMIRIQELVGIFFYEIMEENEK